MNNLRQIKRRMKSVHNILEITKAMEVISAIRFRKADANVKKARPYVEELQALVIRLLRSLHDEKEGTVYHPLLHGPREPKAKKEFGRALVVFSADRGLCGSYNTVLLSRAVKFLNEDKETPSALFTSGNKTLNFFKRRHWPILKSWTDIGQGVDRVLSDSMVGAIRESFESGRVGSVTVLYMALERSGICRPRLLPFLGLSEFLKEVSVARVPSVDRSVNYISEPALTEILGPLLEFYVRSCFHLYLLESKASEFSSRMAAMKKAHDNSEEMITHLTLLRNKLRQAGITREITEITSGAEALVG